MWPNLQETADLVKFTEEILNEKFHFLCMNTAESDVTITISTQAYLHLEVFL